VKRGEELIAFCGKRGKWTKCVEVTSSSSASKQVVEEQVHEMEMQEDKEFKQTMLDTEIPYLARR